MSGGSYDYMYTNDEPAYWQIKRMADRLSELGFTKPALETYALLPKVPSSRLREVWRAVEWLDSNDWGLDQVERVVQDEYGA